MSSGPTAPARCRGEWHLSGILDPGCDSRVVSRSVNLSGRATTALSVVAAALVVAFVIAPAPLAGARYAGERRVSAAFDQAFIEYWRSGDGKLSPGVQQLVDYWFRFHVVKAVIAALLLAVLVLLGVRLWAAFVRAGRHRALLGWAGALVTMLGLLSLTVLMANVQGLVAPFSSLLPMLQDGSDTGGLGDTADGSARLVLRSLGVLAAAGSLIVAAIVAGNISVAVDPAPALLAFFQGGW
jgi:hypothetical protein